MLFMRNKLCILYNIETFYIYTIINEMNTYFSLRKQFEIDKNKMLQSVCEYNHYIFDKYLCQFSFDCNRLA